MLLICCNDSDICSTVNYSILILDILLLAFISLIPSYKLSTYPFLCAVVFGVFSYITIPIAAPFQSIQPMFAFSSKVSHAIQRNQINFPSYLRWDFAPGQYCFFVIHHLM